MSSLPGESKTSCKIRTALCRCEITGRIRIVLLMWGVALPSPPPLRVLSLSTPPSPPSLPPPHLAPLPPPMPALFPS
ncbi:hypothetical protein ACFX14_018052 [Malus domestica]